MVAESRPRVCPDDDDPDDLDPGRHEIHLMVSVPSIEAALDLAERIAEALVFMPELSVGETTVSIEGDLRFNVYCDRRITHNDRCKRRNRHAGPCSAIV
jgi:hypothetical protein